MPSLRGGGAERVALTLACAFAAHGVATDLVVFDDDGPLRAELPPAVGYRPLGGRGALAGLPRLVRYLRQARPRVVLSTLTHANVIAVWARFLAGRERSCPRTRLVLRDGSPIHSPLAERPRRDRLLRALVRMSYPRADALLANAHDLAREIDALTGRRPAPCVVLPNPISFARLAAQASTHPIAPADLPSSQGPLVVAIGRLVPQKDHAMLLAALAILRQRVDARLVILGEGPGRADLLRLRTSLGLAEVVALPGFRLAAPFLARARLLVSAARFEGSSNALGEALAFGVPVVATSGPGDTADLLGADLAASALVPPGDPAALAAAMARALAHPPDPAALRERVASHDLETVLPAYARLLAITIPPPNGAKPAAPEPNRPNSPPESSTAGR